MANRLNLHNTLVKILGSKNVYYDPPGSVQMNYPAIRYSRKKIENTFAGNSVYKQDNCYEITVIYDDPDSEIPTAISVLPMCSHDRHYKADNLYHDVFTLYH